MKVYELLDSPAKWTQHEFARDKQGKYVPPISPEAERWCLFGAMYKCYPTKEQMDEVIMAFHNVGKFGLALYNDTHSYEEVIALCKSLDI